MAGGFDEQPGQEAMIKERGLLRIPFELPSTVLA